MWCIADLGRASIYPAKRADLFQMKQIMYE